MNWMFIYQQILANEEHFGADHFQDGNKDCQKACVNTSSWVFDDGVHVSMQLSVSACKRVDACKRFTVWIEMLTFLYENFCTIVCMAEFVSCNLGECFLDQHFLLLLNYRLI